MPSRYRVIVAPAVLAELVEIGQYLKEDSPRAAVKMLGTITEAFDSLERTPLRGALISENSLWGGDYRHLIREPYRIIYRVVGEDVRVIKIIHGARLLKIDPGRE